MVEQVNKSSVVLKGVRLAVVLSCFLPAAKAALDEASIDDFSEAPGLNWLDGERYDPFTGVMKYRITDFKIPGNGTLDLVVVRDTKAVLVPTISIAHSTYSIKNPQQDRGSYSYTVAKNTFSCKDPSTTGPSYSGSKKPVVLDLYGEKIHFYSSKNPAFPKHSYFPSNADFISSSNWYISCQNSAVTAHSPSGVKWVFDASKAINKGELKLTKIEDSFGNYLEYSYKPKADHSHSIYRVGFHSNEPASFYETAISNINVSAISQIKASDSDGRQVNFHYDSKFRLYQYNDNSSPNRRLRKIDVNGTWVEREDGKRWTFTYYKPYSGGPSDVLRSVTNPNGLKVTYQHAKKKKGEYLGTLWTSDPLYSATQRYYPTLSERTFHSTDGKSEKWEFDSAASSNGWTITRTISAPSGTMDYTYDAMYRSNTNTTSGISTRYPDERKTRGKLRSFTRYGTNTTTNLATFRSKTDNSKAADGMIRREYVWDVDNFFDHTKVKNFDNRSGYYKANRQRLRSVTTKVYSAENTSGTHYYGRYFSGHDHYGKPKTITETRPAGGNRTTTISYLNSTNPTLWRIGRWNNKTISGVGSESRTFDYRGPVKTHTQNKITTNFEYDDEGNLKKVTDAEGNYSEYTNYYLGIAREERDPNGNSRYLTVNSDGTVKTESIWGNSGAKWAYAYDSLRRLSSVTSPISGSATRTFSWSTNTAGKTTTRTEKLGGTTTRTTTYNSLLLPTAETVTGNRGNIYSNWEYDVLGRLKKQVLNRTYDYQDGTRRNNGVTTEFSYDGLDRITAENHTLANGSKKTARYKYGISGNKLYTQRTDLRGKVTRTLLEAYGSPNSAWPVNINRAGVETKIGRDVVGRMTSLTQGGLTRSYSYLAAGSAFEGLLNYETHPETGTTTYGYKADGEIDYVSTGGQTTYYSYFKDNQLQRINRAGSNADVNYTYYPDGSLKSTSVDNGTTTAYEYDLEGKLEEETVNAPGKSFALKYGYNWRGHLASIKYPTGRTYQFAPDILGRATEIKGGGKTIADNLYYWGAGATAQASFGSNMSFRQTLTPNHLPDLRTTRINSSVKLQHNYGYDDARNVSSIGITGSIGLNDSLSMSYDNINRLETVSSSSLGNRRFEYDDEDNIDWVETNGSRSDYNYDAKNRLTSISGPLARWGFRYDDRGNTLDNGKVDLTFNAANQVLSTSDGNSYLYDGHGRRVRTTKSGKHVYNVYGQDGVLRYRFDADKGTHSEYHYVAGKMVARRDSSLSDDGGGSGGGNGGGSGGGSGSGGEGAFEQTGNGVVSMEAESATLEAGSSADRWEVQTLSGASNSQGAVAVGSGYYGGTDAGTYAMSPRLHWQVTADRSGNHDVWVRTYTKNGSTDSVHLSVDNTFRGTYWHGSADYNKWVWKKLSVSMTSGQTHTVTLWAREMGIAIDKIVIVPTGTNVPSGSGPTETTRDGSGGGSGGSGGGSGGGTGGSGGGSGSGGEGAFIQGSDKTVSLEAENAERTALNGEWQTLDDTDYSNDQAVKASVTSRRDYGSGPSLKWTIKAAHGGEYKVWALIRNTGGNSVYTNLDGDNGYQYFASSTSWGWREFWNRKVNLTAGGEHTFEIWARDPGVEIDKVVLLPSSNSAPTGEGPAESSRDGEGTGGSGGGTGGSGGGTGGGTGGSGGGTGSSGEGAYLQGSDKRFTMEAENAERTLVVTGKWADLLGAGMSGDAAVKLDISTWGYGAAAQGPSLTWTLKATHGGNYHVWLRTRSADGDSVFTDMDGATQDQHFSTSASWTWFKLNHATVALAAGGEHTFKIWAREAGLEIDKVMLIPVNDSYAPSGVGPVESTRDGEPDSGGSNGDGTGGGTGGSGVYLQSADKTVSLEMESGEHTALNGDWQILLGAGLSNEQGMRANVTGRKDYGNSPSLKWTIKAAHSGEYKVWALIRNTGGNSVYTNLDGDNGYQYFASSTSWGWREFWNRRINLTAGGEHTFEIWARDPGVEIDKVVLLPSSSPAPTGLGPATSAQQ